jgi:hypothetical protein
MSSKVGRPTTARNRPMTALNNRKENKNIIEEEVRRFINSEL